MKETNFQYKIANATKWSTITEIAAKLITPITNMILARILAPKAFGVVATVTMIISFADMFADSGFQKYLIQHEFRDDKEKYKNANVAFWTNFGISISLWCIIIVFRESLAKTVGNPGLGNVIAISCVQLPIMSFSSIQMALYRREFKFRTLFLARIVSVCTPFVVTIPLALLGLSYWSLIIGTITTQLLTATILTIKSKWKPRFFYSVILLKEMLSFSLWSLIESISIWLSMWVDTLIIGSFLNQHYLGLYKTSTAMVNSLTGLVTASVVPVLFSALSRLQKNNQQFNLVFYKFQRMISILIFPLGIGIYLYKDLATHIFLGSQWNEATNIIGMWSLTRSIKIVLGDPCSEVYRSKGRPRLSFLAQIFHLIFLVPTCLISVKKGFWHLVYARSLIQLQFVLVHLILMKKAFGISAIKTVNNILPSAFAALIMGVFGYFLKQISDNILWSAFSILLCAAFYFAVLLMFSNVRKEIFSIVKSLLSTTYKYKYAQSYERS